MDPWEKEYKIMQAEEKAKEKAVKLASKKQYKREPVKKRNLMDLSKGE